MFEMLPYSRKVSVLPSGGKLQTWSDSLIIWRILLIAFPRIQLVSQGLLLHPSSTRPEWDAMTIGSSVFTSSSSDGLHLYCHRNVLPSILITRSSIPDIHDFPTFPDSMPTPRVRIQHVGNILRITWINSPSEEPYKTSIGSSRGLEWDLGKCNNTIPEQGHKKEPYQLFISGQC